MTTQTDSYSKDISVLPPDGEPPIIDNPDTPEYPFVGEIDKETLIKIGAVAVGIFVLLNLARRR